MTSKVEPESFNDTKNAHDEIADGQVETTEVTLAHQSYSDVEAHTSLEDVSESVGKTITTTAIAYNNESPEQVAEKIVAGDALIIHPSWMSLMPQIIGALLLTFVIFLVSALILTNGEYVPFNALFIPVCLFAVILHKRYNSKYMITVEGVFIIRGIIGLEVSRVRVPYTKIREFELRKGIIHRIMFLSDADIYISTMLFDEPEIEMAGFPNPVFYVTLLRLMQRRIAAITAESTSELQKAGMADTALAR